MLPPLFAFLAALWPAFAGADSFRLDLHESVLTRLATRVGGTTFHGSHTIRGPVTGKVIYSASWSAELSNVQFSISPTGITYTAKLDASYGIFSYATTVSGTASVEIRNNRLTFSLNQLNVPVRFYIPIIKKYVEVYRIRRTLPYHFSTPFGASQLQTDNNQSVVLFPGRITREYRWGCLRLRGQVFVQ
jgi:hypothetical protein